MRVRKSNSYKWSAVTLSVLFIIGVLTLAAFRQQPSNTLPDGTTIGGIDVGGKTVDEAMELLKPWRTQETSSLLKLNVKLSPTHEMNWQPSLTDVGLDIDLNSMLSKAIANADKQGLGAKIASLVNKSKPDGIPIVWTFNETKCLHYLKTRILPHVELPSRNARFIPDGDKFKIIPDKYGRSLNLKIAVELILHSRDEPAHDSLELPLTIVPPRITSKDLPDDLTELAHYSTHYYEPGNRGDNILLACSKINGTLLEPGDVFSYNKVVGPRDQDTGFRIAPVIIKGKLEPGLGGGVCQVSSTLYNAALLSNLQIVERVHHAFPVHYLPAGRDATVSYGSIDLQFKNTTKGPLLICASGSDGRVRMRIYGRKQPGMTVKVDRTQVSSWKPPLQIVHTSDIPPNKTKVIDEGKYGHRVTVIRYIYVYGKLVSKQIVSRDYYQAFPRIVEVGVAPQPDRKAITLTNPTPDPVH